MSSLIRITVISCFMLLAISTACGGSPGNVDPCEDCPTLEDPLRCGGDSGCEPYEPPPPPPPPARYNVTMRVKNDTQELRTCYLSALWVENGAPVTKTIVAEEYVAPGERRSGVASVPADVTVSLMSMCFAPDHSEIEEAHVEVIFKAIRDCRFDSAYIFLNGAPLMEEANAC